MKKYPIVEIKWIDPSGKNGWREKQAFLESKISECRGVGYLIVSNRKQIVIVQNIDDANDLMSDSTCIPRSCVKSIRKLKVYD